LTDEGISPFRLAQVYGLARSYLIYYGLPWRHTQLRRLYAQFVRPGELCLDVGAHLGNRLRAMVGAGARVVALEPHPVLFRQLKRMYGRRPGVTLLEQAVGASVGSASLHADASNPTIATLSPEWAAAALGTTPMVWDYAFSITVTTLDALIDRYGAPAFCKLDIEGSELDALQGLTRPIPALSFEYHPPARQLAIRCVTRLLEVGSYDFNWTDGESAKLRSEVWISGSELIGWLESLPGGRGFGEIYARLSRSPA
jgi:FkbM family methyltransferase